MAAVIGKLVWVIEKTLFHLRADKAVVTIIFLLHDDRIVRCPVRNSQSAGHQLSFVTYFKQAQTCMLHNKDA